MESGRRRPARGARCAAGGAPGPCRTASPSTIATAPVPGRRSGTEGEEEDEDKDDEEGRG
eukprot:6957412-Pyramimonas_sp.AAC.1